MDWTRAFDNYCERTDLTFWSEPLNAITNAAFLIAAVWMWRRCEGVVGARVLCAILFAIGVGSFLFHTTATIWAGVADVVPIAAFILYYLYLANREFVGMPVWASLLVTAGFIPYAAVMIPIFNTMPFFAISNAYWTVPLLLVVYSAFLYRRIPETVRGMIIGAVILTVSISVRSIDESLCEHWPIGTHILWHILNAIMLAWMIEVYRLHHLRAKARLG